MKQQLKWALVALVALATVAYAASGQGRVLNKLGVFDGYLPDKQVAAFRSGVAAVDSVDLSDPASTGVDLFGIGPAPTLSVSPRFTDDGASCTVTVAFYYYTGGTYYLLGIDDSSSLVATTEAGAGVYTDETFLFDSYGATHALVLVTTASLNSGTVDLWVGSY